VGQAGKAGPESALSINKQNGRRGIPPAPHFFLGDLPSGKCLALHSPGIGMATKRSLVSLKNLPTTSLACFLASLLPTPSNSTIWPTWSHLEVAGRKPACDRVHHAPGTWQSAHITHQRQSCSACCRRLQVSCSLQDGGAEDPISAPTLGDDLSFLRCFDAQDMQIIRVPVQVADGFTHGNANRVVGPTVPRLQTSPNWGSGVAADRRVRQKWRARRLAPGADGLFETRHGALF
jgi:hypothetical protein